MAEGARTADVPSGLGLREGPCPRRDWSVGRRRNLRGAGVSGEGLGCGEAGAWEGLRSCDGLRAQAKAEVGGDGSSRSGLSWVGSSGTGLVRE